MSKPVSPLNGAKFEGYVSVKALGLQGMITLRGNLRSTKLKAAVKSVAGVTIPKQRKIELVDQTGAAWMSPDELLIFVPYETVANALEELNESVAGEHMLAVNVSDARAMFQVEGPAVREILAKLCPVDMSSDQFTPGDIRRTRMAQIPAAFWMPAEDRAQIVCFRSVADYAFNLLKDAAEPGGETGFFKGV